MSQKLSELTVDDLKAIMKETNVEILAGLAKLTDEVRELKTQNEFLMHEIELLKLEREKDRRRIAILESQIKGKNLIFKGLDSKKSPNEAVKSICTDVLKMIDTTGIKSTKKIFEKEGKMTILVEFQANDNIEDVIKKTTELKGTGIYIERDLDAEKQQNKVVLLQLKKEILAASKKYRILVRDDRLKVNNKWLKFNKEKKLVCGKDDGVTVLKEFYGNELNIIINYDLLLNKLNLKN